MLVSLSHTARSLRPVALRALSTTAGCAWVRAMSTHGTHPIDFQKVRGPPSCMSCALLRLPCSHILCFLLQRDEQIPPLAHPEDYKPNDLYEDEFEYGIAGEPTEGIDEFDRNLLLQNKIMRSGYKIDLPTKHGNEALWSTMSLADEARLKGKDTK